MDKLFHFSISEIKMSHAENFQIDWGKINAEHEEAQKAKWAKCPGNNLDGAQWAK